MGGISSTDKSNVLLTLRQAVLCNVKAESSVDQEAFESLVFSLSHHSDEVQQLSPTTIRMYSEDFEVIKKLGAGAYGAVFMFQSRTPMYLAIKFSDTDDESRISEALLNTGCRTLRVRSVGKKLMNPSTGALQYAYFMELAEGTLDKFLTTLHEQNRDKALSLTKTEFKAIYLYIGEQIRQQMVCLYDLEYKSYFLGLFDTDKNPVKKHTYVYLDLKVQNVLFKCDSQKRLDQTRFFLGDLGGAVPGADDGSYVSTYPPIEHRDSGGLVQLPTPFDKEAAMSWELGVLLLFMADPNKPELSNLTFGNIPGITQDKYDALYNEMVDFYGMDIASLLHTDLAQRRDIRKSLVPSSQKRKRDDEGPAQKRARK